MKFSSKPVNPWALLLLLIGLAAFALVLSTAAADAAESPGTGTVITDPQPPPAADEPLTDARKIAIVDAVTRAFIDNYIFLEDARKMETRLKQNLADGAYDKIADLRVFAGALTRDLRAVNGDRHIGIDILDPMRAVIDSPDKTDPDIRKARLEQAKRSNFQFKKVEILEGNVGYLRLDMFADASVAGSTAIAAMNFLGYCDAVIFDLRHNGGGNPSMIQLLTSYLVEEPTHLNSFYIRKTDETRQFWTQAYVPGPRLTNADVYVLTSRYTFSGAEEFTYNIKHLKRGVIIGETTGGGAHPVESHPFPDLGIVAVVPFGRAINPISGENWEGTGVTPDIDVPADDALLTAHREALKTLQSKTDDPDRKRSLEWAYMTIESILNPPVIESKTMKKYAGTYTDRQLKLSDSGGLLYRRGDRPWTALIPVTETLFRMENLDFFRLEIVLDENGQPVKLVGHYNDGRSDASPRTSAAAAR